MADPQAIKLSVILCTYNPHPDRITPTINSLKHQTLAIENWELIIVDNNSDNNVLESLDLTWHPSACIITEAKQGLTYSRLCGFKKALGDIVVMADDDNLLDTDYLQETIGLFENHPELGALGGKSIPQFEVTPPGWLEQFYGNLALRDLGNEVIVNGWPNEYPHAAPIGAGMAIRKTALASYLNYPNDTKTTDRTATSLASGGDNEIVITILKSGWLTGYFPQLQLQHLIPKERMAVNYLARLLHDTNKSWVQLLEKHSISPWGKISSGSVVPRKIKAWFTYKAWKNQVNFIKWKGACGLFEGMAATS